jgi:hypothetical protein
MHTERIAININQDNKLIQQNQDSDKKPEIEGDTI